MGRKSRLKKDRRQAQLAQIADRERLAADALDRGCLFCRRTDGGFTSEEHILPESLGNTEMILPPGIVCDRCNNGPLAIADAALLNYPPITFMRVTRGIPNKAGDYPTAKFNNGTLRCRAPGDIVFETNSPKSSTTKLDPGSAQTQITLNLTKNPMTKVTTANISRALCKMALEFTWLDEGEASALDPKRDPMRRFVLGEKQPGFLALVRITDPRDGQLSVTHHPVEIDGQPAHGVFTSIYGVALLTAYGLERPVEELPAELADVHTF